MRLCSSAETTCLVHVYPCPTSPRHALLSLECFITPGIRFLWPFLYLTDSIKGGLVVLRAALTACRLLVRAFWPQEHEYEQRAGHGCSNTFDLAV